MKKDELCLILDGNERKQISIIDLYNEMEKTETLIAMLRKLFFLKPKTLAQKIGAFLHFGNLKNKSQYSGCKFHIPVAHEEYDKFNIFLEKMVKNYEQLSYTFCCEEHHQMQAGKNLIIYFLEGMDSVEKISQVATEINTFMRENNIQTIPIGENMKNGDIEIPGAEGRVYFSFDSDQGNNYNGKYKIKDAKYKTGSLRYVEDWPFLDEFKQIVCQGATKKTKNFARDWENLSLWEQQNLNDRKHFAFAVQDEKTEKELTDFLTHNNVPFITAETVYRNNVREKKIVISAEAKNKLQKILNWLEENNKNKNWRNPASWRKALDRKNEENSTIYIGTSMMSAQEIKNCKTFLKKNNIHFCEEGVLHGNKIYESAISVPYKYEKKLVQSLQSQMLLQTKSGRDTK